MVNLKPQITRALALSALLCLAPITFGSPGPEGSGPKLVVASEACAAIDDCCFELYSLCGDRPNMAACGR